MNLLNCICHRKPERSFHIKKYQFPVCARCTGFYISIFAYTIGAMYVYFNYTTQTTVLGVLLLVPVFLDGITQLLELRESNNFLRLTTGLLGGLGLMIILKTLKLMFIYS